MSDESAFLRTIADRPDEDTPRLVYADWIEERGDPNRAELIRIQCGLARGEDWITGKPIADTARQEALTARVRELITGMRRVPVPVNGVFVAPMLADQRPAIRELTPEIAEVLANQPEDELQRITFHRGMIDYLDLTDTNIASLPPDLHVSGNLYLGSGAITALPPNLHVGGNLYLGSSPITTLPPDLHVSGNLSLARSAIASLPPDLHVGGYLNLRATPITSLPPGLHVGGDLNLWGTRITTLPPDLHVGGNLNLYGTGITVAAARRIFTMPNLSAQARISGLESAGFITLADEARRLRANEPGTPPH